MLLRKLLAGRWVPLPRSLVIEITSFCNLRCVMCPKTHGAVNTEEDRVMSRETFDSLKSIFPFLTSVELSGLWGEAFMHPDLYIYMLNNLKKFPINVSTISNGTLLKDELARELVKAGLDRLVISVDAATQETYSTIRTPGSLQAVISGLESLRKWKNQMNSPLPRVELVFLGMKRNIAEFPEFVRMAHRLGVGKVTLQALGEYERVRGESVAMNYKETGRRFYEEGRKLGEELGLTVELRPGDQFDEDRGGRNMALDLSRMRKDCPDLWLKAVITTAGDVLPCCSTKAPVGKLSQQGFAEIWRGAAYRKLREQIGSAEPPDMCKVCTGMPWVPSSAGRQAELAVYLMGLQLNRTFGKMSLYRSIKPLLKKLRNATVGEPVPER